MSDEIKSNAERIQNILDAEEAHQVAKREAIQWLIAERTNAEKRIKEIRVELKLLGHRKGRVTKDPRKPKGQKPIPADQQKRLDATNKKGESAA